MFVDQHQAPCTSASRPARRNVEACLPAPVRDALERHFAGSRRRYILQVLNAEDLAVLTDVRDALIIARIKRMSVRRLQRYDRLMPRLLADQRFYFSLQQRWLCDEEYFLGMRLGRRPTYKEVSIDFFTHRNGLRFRAYFALKFPTRVARNG